MLNNIAKGTQETFVDREKLLNRLHIYKEALISAVLDELSRKRAYGCVSFDQTGSHTDMNYHSFLDSIYAITEQFDKIDWLAISDFNGLRKLGIGLEKSMFTATGGVNTHKGLIFLQLFLLFAFLREIPFSDWTDYLVRFSRPLAADYERTEDFRSAKYLKLGIRDIRQLPLSGFADLFRLMKEYEEIIGQMDHWDKNTRDDYLTLRIIECFDDTTTIQRTNIQTLRKFQNLAGRICSAYRDRDTRASIMAEDLDQAYLAVRASSGGTADLFTSIRTLQYLRRKI